LLETIFIKIPSLDDEELVPTLFNAINSAKYPERIHIGVSLMYAEEKTKNDFIKAITLLEQSGAKIKYNVKKFKEGLLGVGRQRHIVNNMYDGQDYVLQIDAHTWFCDDWDEILIALHSGEKKHILTAYAGWYGYRKNGSRGPIGSGRFRYPQIIEGFRDYIKWTDNWADYPLYNYEQKMIEIPKFCAGFAFGTKEWGEYPGLVRESIFWSEEPLQTAYLKLNGFELYFPNIDKAVICHLYGQFIRKSGKRKAFTDYISEEKADYLMNQKDKTIYESHMLKIEKLKPFYDYKKERSSF